MTLSFLGTREYLEQDLYATEWQSCGGPPSVEPGEEFLAAGRVRNASPHPWSHQGPARVRLSYRWLDAQGREVPVEALRTELPSAIEPGVEVATWIQVVAPRVAGSYVLEIEPLFENVAWFSSHDPAAICRIAVTVGVSSDGA